MLLKHCFQVYLIKKYKGLLKKERNFAVYNNNIWFFWGQNVKFSSVLFLLIKIVKIKHKKTKIPTKMQKYSRKSENLRQNKKFV